VGADTRGAAPRLTRAQHEALVEALRPHAATPTLCAAIAGALADYRVWRRCERARPPRRHDGRVFVARLLARLRAVDQLIAHAPGVTHATTAAGRPLATLELHAGTWLAAQAHTTWRPVIGAWMTDARAEIARLAPDRHRPRDEARLRLACAVADALDTAGIRPTRTRSGVYCRVLADVVWPVLGLDDTDPHKAARTALEALPAWRALPPWHR
jgi:hypothetical protein